MQGLFAFTYVLLYTSVNGIYIPSREGASNLCFSLEIAHQSKKYWNVYITFPFDNCYSGNSRTDEYGMTTDHA